MDGLRNQLVVPTIPIHVHHPKSLLQAIPINALAARPWFYLVSAIKLIWRGAPQNKVRGSEATEGVFCLRTKKPFHGTVRTGLFYFILVVCLIAYSSRIFAPLTARAVRY